MGCWNKTCGLSNLHIRAGEEVYVFVLEQNLYHDRCYATAFWKPALLPFYAKYDDYGGGEDCSGIGLPIIINNIKNSLVELEQGENQYHDIPVKKESFDVSVFFEAVHEGRLKIKYWSSESPIDFVMFKKEVVDHILENWVQEEYVGDGKGTTGWENNYIAYKFEDILKDIPEFFELVQEKFEKVSDSMSLGYGIQEVVPFRHPNKVASWIRGDSHRYSSLGDADDVFLQHIKNNEIHLATELIRDLLIARYLNCFLEMTRKLWQPGCHEGSQGQDASGYLVLMDAMRVALNRETSEQEE